MALKAKKAATKSVAEDLTGIMNQLDVPKAEGQYDYSKYFPMLDEVKTDFAASMRVRINTGRSLSEKMVAALDRMLDGWTNKPDYSKYFPMLDKVKQTDFVISMKDCIARGGVLTEGMTQALEAMLDRFKEAQKPSKPKKPSKVDVLVRVRKWMTTDKFDRPLPLMEMEGEILEEKGKMIKVRLQGSSRPSGYCRHCGREITHPVSLLYGIGPKCGEHYWEDFTGASEANYKELKKRMAKLLWEGWIPRSQCKITPIEE